MNIKDVLSKCDHTLLKQQATINEIIQLCDEGIKYQTASVCIPPCFVKDARKHVENKLKICTVIGFPNGYNTTKVKVYETSMAINDGADEIDMVINIGKLKERDYTYILNEIKEVKKACQGKILKVIIETCLLTEEEKIIMCNLCFKAGADYIKTSTGFSSSGATIKDVKILVENSNENLKVKASGGISNISDAELFIELGADRLGTSKVVKEVIDKGV